MRAAHNAFTLIEVLIVVLILGILAAVAVPKFSTASDDARTAATQSTLAGVRSAIATYRTGAVIAGDDPYPTLSQLTDGTVLRFDLPVNPFTKLGGVQGVSSAQANTRTVVNPTTNGWNYFVDNDANPPVVVFYANCDDATTAPDGSGGVVDANDL